MDCSPPDSSVHGISQARILVWVVFSFPGGLPNLGMKPVSLAFTDGFFITEPPGKPLSQNRCSIHNIIFSYPLIFEIDIGFS